jgi:hypothetical protein
MLGKKKLLLSLALVAVMLAGGITAGTQLLIEQPVSASISVEGIGGSSPSFNVIDNVFADPGNPNAGAAAGYINPTSDFYVIGFGATNPGGAWALSFGRSQTATVGDGTDYVFKLQNNYAKTMTVNLLKKAVSYESGSLSTLGTGVVIKFMNADTGVAQWTLTGATTSPYTDWTITNNPLTLDSGGTATFYLKVENDEAVVSPAGGWTPRVRFQATAD